MSKISSCLLRWKKNANIKCLNNFLWTQQIRLRQTNAASTAVDDKSLDANTEWQLARPFEEIPTESVFKVWRSFMPGGRYYRYDFEKLMNGFKQDYGDIFLLPGMFGKPPTLMTYNPDDFERVYRNEGIWPIRPGSEVIAYHRGTYRADIFQGVEGIISTQGEKWGKFRSAVNPVLMQPKSVRLYLNKMSQVNLEFIERIKEMRNAETLEVPDTFEEEINRWTLESVSVVALDKQLGLIKKNRDDPQAKELFKNLTEFFTVSVDLEINATLWKYIPTPKYKRAMKALDNIKDITFNYTNEALQRLEEDAKNGVTRSENEKSVLEKLLKMDKKIATVMAMDMLMAGVDTTSSTFVGIMLCLAKNPEKQEKLRAEIKSILPEKDTNFTEESIKRASYLRACIKEALRMYPLVVGNARVPQKDCVLSGFRVPKGTIISMPTSSLQYNDKYFPRANEYLPERWLRSQSSSSDSKATCPNAASLKPTNPFAYLPFGFGSRMCIGKRIVDMELELGIARIIRNFRVEFNHPTDNAFKSILINVPNIPLKFKFIDID